MKWIFIIFGTIFFLFLSGCYTGNILQTAKPVEKGKANFSGGLTYYIFDYFPVDNERPPSLTGMLRVGVSNRSDIGFKYTTGLWGHFKTDYKIALLNNDTKGIYLSSGIGLDLFLMQTMRTLTLE